MLKRLIFFLLATIGCSYSEAQQGLADSIRTLFEKIDSIPLKESGSCKKNVNNYKSNLSKLDPAPLQDAIDGFVGADAQFINASKGKSCPVLQIVENLDSLLKSFQPKDSVQILNALLYLKYSVLDSEFARVSLRVQNDSNASIENPEISIKSFAPSIMSPGGGETAIPIEIYLRKEVSYFFTISDTGFVPYQMQLNVAQDTTLSITLSSVIRQPSTVIHESSSPNYWWIPALLSGLILGALSWKIMSGKKNRTAPVELAAVQPSTVNRQPPTSFSEETIQKLNEQLRQKETLINKYAGEIQTLHASIRPTEAKYFLTEMMMTAGPRKRRMNEANSDKDLGEDVCGFIMIGDEVLAWVLDGTSDYYCLRNPQTQREYFSSRLLAQSIARELKAHFGEGKMEAFDQTMIQIINDVKSNWLAAMALLPDTEKNLLKSNIQSGTRPECATTVLIGRLSLGGGLVVYRSGDSKMLVYRKSGDQKVFLDTTLSSKNPKSNDRVFFRMGLTEKGELDIQHNKPDFEIVRLDNIQTIIGISDGIGKETENDLKREYPVHAEEMRKEIIYQLQGTEDDKSLVIVEIKG